MELQTYQNLEKSISKERLVAELTLGFWTALMGKKYNTQKFQYAILKNAFPYCPKNRRTTSQLQKELSEIRFLRNRIAADFDSFPVVYEAGIAPFLKNFS